MIAALLLAASLPQRLEPPAPFPTILTDAPSFSAVAPGVEFGEYDLWTQKGPIVVHALAIAPHAPSISLESVLAGDALTSPGETLSSMAHRTGAIGGINADYFDIGNTNRPTNIVVHDGALLRTPRKRYALLVTNDGARIAEDAFAGTVALGAKSVALDAVNDLPPPHRGTAVITPAFGAIAPADDLTLVQLAPVDGTPPFCTYRVTGIADNTARSPAGYYLAIGVDAYGTTGVPGEGDTIAVSGDLTPVPLASIVAAVGGGPLLLEDGAPVDDPDGPNGAEYAARIPASGVALAADGTLFMLEVDGRQPDRSIGVTRPEFASLMRAFGAQRGMAFDGGGSSELVAQTQTQTQAILSGVPSDGRERPVADGIFVYDTATPGPPAQIAAAPQAIHAMPGARVPLRIAFADANDRVVADAGAIDLRVEPASLGTVEDGAFVARAAGTGTIVVRSGTFIRAIAVEVSDDPARVEILPHDPNAAVDGTARLQARAFDARGYALALPSDLPWRALHATIDSHGTLQTGRDDALVSLLLGNHVADITVSVGYHDVALQPEHPHVMTVPPGQSGSVQDGDPCERCLSLTYALGPAERAAYLTIATPLPDRSVALAFDVYDDGKGALLKLALRNAINEEVLLSGGPLDRPGWRSVRVPLPAELAQPARVAALYVIEPHAGMNASGSIAIRNLRAVVAGAARKGP